MVNWSRYKITGKSTNSDYIRFDLDSCVEYSSGRSWHIDCEEYQPFTMWQIGDGVQIDTEKTLQQTGSNTFSFYDDVIYQFSSHWEDKYDDLLTEKNNLENERNEWRTKIPRTLTTTRILYKENKQSDPKFEKKAKIKREATQKKQKSNYSNYYNFLCKCGVIFDTFSQMKISKVISIYSYFLTNFTFTFFSYS